MATAVHDNAAKWRRMKHLHESIPKTRVLAVKQLLKQESDRLREELQDDLFIPPISPFELFKINRYWTTLEKGQYCPSRYKFIINYLKCLEERGTLKRAYVLAWPLMR